MKNVSLAGIDFRTANIKGTIRLDAAADTNDRDCIIVRLNDRNGLSLQEVYRGNLWVGGFEASFFPDVIPLAKLPQNGIAHFGDSPREILERPQGNRFFSQIFGKDLRFYVYPYACNDFVAVQLT